MPEMCEAKVFGFIRQPAKIYIRFGVALVIRFRQQKQVTHVPRRGPASFQVMTDNLDLIKLC